MASYKQIDDYIDDLEEKNVIYIEKELLYAEKCHNLEEELGCPLEVVFNLLNEKIVIFGKYIGKVLDIRKEGEVFCIHYFNGTLNEDDIEPLSNYQKTWWLSKTKEE